MRGRVMSLWFVAFQGSTPIGGPIVGWVMAVAGARAGLGLGAVTCLIVAAVGLVMLRARTEDALHGRAREQDAPCERGRPTAAPRRRDRQHLVRDARARAGRKAASR